MQKFICLFSILFLTACGTSIPHRGSVKPEVQTQRSEIQNKKAGDVVIYALALMDTGYRFGGKNPEAGLDCSGLVSYVFQKSIGVKILGNARDIAKKGQRIEKEELQPGDLVFFNTRGFSYSHVGIYVGENKFIHAPRTNSQVKVNKLTEKYYMSKFEEARRII